MLSWKGPVFILEWYVPDGESRQPSRLSGRQNSISYSSRRRRSVRVMPSRRQTVPRRRNGAGDCAVGQGWECQAIGTLTVVVSNERRLRTPSTPSARRLLSAWQNVVSLGLDSSASEYKGGTGYAVGLATSEDVGETGWRVQYASLINTSLVADDFARSQRSCCCCSRPALLFSQASLSLLRI